MTFFPPGGGTDTDITADPTKLPPFIPGGNDDLPSELNLIPKIGNPRFIDPDQGIPGDVYTIKIPVSLEVGQNQGRQVTDYGYLIFLEDDEGLAPVKAILNYAQPQNNAPVLNGVISATFQVKPKKIKVTILTKKSVPIQLA